MRRDIPGEELLISLPIPPPKMWILESAFVDSPRIPLPKGDLNFENLGSWFERKRFVELTCGVLDRDGAGLVVATPTVAVAAEELTLEEKFMQGVGTNLPLSLFLETEQIDSIKARISEIAGAFGLEGYARIDLFWEKGTDTLHLLEINTLCGLTEATVFYSQWLGSEDPLPPWGVLDRIVNAGLVRFQKSERRERRTKSASLLESETG
jgi:hypothetical protein